MSWTSGQWTQQLFGGRDLGYLAAGGGILVAVDSNRFVALRYLDGALEWNTAPALSIPDPDAIPADWGAERQREAVS